MSRSAHRRYSKVRTRISLDALKSGFFAVPGLMTLGAIVLASITTRLDETDIVRKLAAAGWLYSGDAGGATALLSTIAGSLIAVVGTVFSVTIAVLTFASSQFGPRLLRNFLRDRGNHVVLGGYVATFVYSLLVLRRVGAAVGGATDGDVVPRASLAVAMVGEMICVGLLIYFIQHIATTIQAPNVIARIANDLRRSIKHLYPGDMGVEPPHRKQDGPDAEVPSGFESDAVVVRFPTGGYIQALGQGELIRLANEHDLLVRLEHAPGDFVVAGDRLALVWPAERVSARIIQEIVELYVVGWERTQLQDLEYHLNQLVEIASRALSPGINDPFTAMQCVDRLADALCVFTTLPVPSPYRYDESGRLRVITTEVQSFEELAAICFDKIRQYGRASVDVTIRLIDAVGTIGTRARRSSDLAVLRRQAIMLERGARTAVTEEWDRDRITERFNRAIATIELASRSSSHLVSAAGRESE